MSVVIPTFNRVRLLRRSIESVLAQDYSGIELIVIDGGSQDGTKDLLASYGSRIARWVSEPDHGEYNALNKGIGMCTGGVIKLMPDDDALRPGAIRSVMEWFARNPQTGVIFGQAAYWQERNGEPAHLFDTTYSPDFPFTVKDLLWQRTPYCSAAAFIRREVFDSAGLFDEGLTNGDTEFFVRCANAGLKGAQIPEILFDYHFHSTNGVIKKLWPLYTGGVRIYCRYGYPAALPLFAATRYFTHYLLPLLSYRYDVHPFRALRKLRRTLTQTQRNATGGTLAR